MRRLLASFVIVAVAAIAAPLAASTSASAAAGANSANAQACQQGGWFALARADGGGFANQGACVSSAAQGATLVLSPQALACSSIGGTFGDDPRPPLADEFTTVFWTCNDWPVSDMLDFIQKESVISFACATQAASRAVFGETGDSICGITRL